jgi:Phospholipase_D-nuclease N-terminal/Short C-terminal domain
LFIAAEYPFLEIMGTIVVFFAWVAWFWILVSVLSDVFRRHDISGWGKAGWSLFVIVVPFLGVLAYLGFQGGKMAERNIEHARAAQARFGGDSATEIANAKQLLDSGTITEDEFAKLKAKALG